MTDESEKPHQGRTLFLVNAIDNPDAEVCESSFSRNWTWIKAPDGWQPEDGIQGDAAAIDAIIVFSTKYEERAIRKLCEAIRRDPRFRQIPLLVAVNQYEMPLANSVKKLPKSGFVFTPLKEADLAERLNRLG